MVSTLVGVVKITALAHYSLLIYLLLSNQVILKLILSNITYFSSGIVTFNQRIFLCIKWIYSETCFVTTCIQ